MKKFFSLAQFKRPLMWQPAIAATPINNDLSSVFTSLSESSAPFIGNLMARGDLAGFLDALFQTAIVVGCILAVLRFAYAGFIYMTKDVWHMKDEAKHTMQNTLLGLILLLAIWLILFQINPQILRLDILDTIKENPAQQSEGSRQN